MSIEARNEGYVTGSTISTGTLKVSDLMLSEHVAPNILFKGSDGNEIIRLEPNGDIFVHGRKAENDKEIVDGLRTLLLSR